MDWEVVRIDDTAKGRTQPAASLGFGRITFNTAACKLLGDYRRYRYVELMRDQGGSPQVGVRFLLEGERTGNSLPIRQRVANDSSSAGWTSPGSGCWWACSGWKRRPRRSPAIRCGWMRTGGTS